MEVPSFSPLSGDGRLPLCAKRKINLRRVIFQSKPNDLQICAKQKAAFGSACSWHGLKDDRLKVQDVSSLYWDSYGVSWKMKGIFRKSMEEGKAWGVSSSTAIRFLWGRTTRRNAETCTNVRKCAQTSGNTHKCATSAVRPPNFAVKKRSTWNWNKS